MQKELYGAQGHLGTPEHLTGRMGVYWPLLRSVIEDFVEKCDAHIAISLLVKEVPELLQLLEDTQMFIWEGVSINRNIHRSRTQIGHDLELVKKIMAPGW